MKLERMQGRPQMEVFAMVSGPAFVTRMSGKLKQRNEDTMIVCERERERAGMYNPRIPGRKMYDL